MFLLYIPELMKGEGMGMGETTRKSTSVIYLILELLASFFFILSTLVTFFWLVGNFRHFLDETLMKLLQLLRWSSLVLSVISIAGFCISFIAFIPRNWKRNVFKSISWIILFCLSVILSGFSGFLLSLVSGMR